MMNIMIMMKYLGRVGNWFRLSTYKGYLIIKEMQKDKEEEKKIQEGKPKIEEGGEGDLSLPS